MSWPFEIAERDHAIQDPISAEKIRRLGDYLRLDDSSTVLDLACGKAGPAMVLAAQFGCRVTGVELRPAFADAARARVAAAGLDHLIDIHVGDAAAYEGGSEAFDAGLCLGASFIWGHIGDAASTLRRTVRQGGFVAVGEPYWRTWPLPPELAREEFVDLPATVARFESADVSLTGLIAASEDDWDHYESLHWRAIEEWLAENSDHADASEIRRQDDEFRSHYLRAQRANLGWAIFVGRRR